MKERPILFSGLMVRGILEGRKTQTRRVMKPQPEACPSDAPWARDRKGGPGHWWPCNAIQSMAHVEDELQAGEVGWEGFAASVCPYGQVGDRLWVRETWAWPGEEEVIYRATDQHFQDLMQTNPNYPQFKWRPSIHMPRWASRITLEITGVRVERLQEIGEEDSFREGVRHALSPSGTTGWGESIYPLPDHVRNLYNYRRAFQDLWNGINADRGFGWDVNPWVWVIEFRRVS